MVNNSWKTVTLSQIGTFRKGSGISRAESNSGTLPAVRYGELYTVHNNYVRTYTSHISREVANQALRVHYGDVLFACSGETKEDIAKCAAIIDDSEVYAGGDIIVLSPTTEVDPIFLGFILNTQNVIQQRAQKAQGDAIVHISTDSIKSIEITLPGYEEQVRIAEALSDIDTLIVNLKKLIAKYKLIKKACLQQMFPQNGEKVPKMRLPGFTGAWEQRKFEELYEKVSRKNDLTYGRDDIISVANMYYKADSYITDDNYLLTYNVFELGDIAFEGNKSKNFAHGRFVENTIGNGIVSHVFDVFKPIMKSYDLMFWKYAINNERLMGDILLRSTKASTMMTNLVASDFLKESFYVPSYEEQKKIGEYLTQLDRLITLHQREVLFSI